MGKRLPTWLTEAERDRLLGAEMSDRNRAIMTVFLYTGLRCNELRMLDIADVDTEEMIIHVRHAKRDKERFIPLHPEIEAALGGYLDGREDGPLFLSSRGERISNRRLRSMVETVGQRAGLKKNCIRTLCATLSP